MENVVSKKRERGSSVAEGAARSLCFFARPIEPAKTEPSRGGGGGWIVTLSLEGSTTLCLTREKP